MSVQLLRNTRLWVSIAKDAETITGTNTWEVLIQDDFSFNQNGNTTDISLNEAGPSPIRGSERFNDSLNPADWSFSTYLRPYLDDKGDADATNDQVLTPDIALWHALASGSDYDPTNTTFKGVMSNKTNMVVSFEDSQYHELLKINLFYLVDSSWYQIRDVQVGQAEISVDIEGIGMTTWTGQGTQIVPLGTTAPFAHTTPEFTLSDEVFSCAAWIKNKLTTLVLKDNNDGAKVYSIPITGGSVTINNNISYLTPNTLSRVDVPIGSFTGSLEITGSLEAYLHVDTNNNIAELLSSELLAELLPAYTADCTTRTNLSTKNSYSLAVCMGGKYASAAPGVVVHLPRAHLSIPSIDTGDVLSTTIEFKGTAADLSSGQELYIGMSPKYTSAEIDEFISSHNADTLYL